MPGETYIGLTLLVNLKTRYEIPSLQQITAYESAKHVAFLGIKFSELGLLSDKGFHVDGSTSSFPPSLYTHRRLLHYITCAPLSSQHTRHRCANRLRYATEYTEHAFRPLLFFGIARREATRLCKAIRDRLDPRVCLLQQPLVDAI